MAQERACTETVFRLILHFWGIDTNSQVEDACLIYSFDIKLKNKTGISEVAIDAVSGLIISNKHETPKQEALEKAADQKK